MTVTQDRMGRDVTAAQMNRRAMLVAGALAATGAGTLLIPTRSRGEVSSLNLQAVVPQRIGAWSNDVDAIPVLPDEAETASINRAYEESVSRFYRRDDGAIVMLVVAHGRPDSGMLAIHRPATCYTAQGFTVTNARAVTLPAPFSQVRADELFAVREEREEPILSWVTIGGRQTGFGITQKLEQLRATWRGASADAILVRASTIGPDVPESYALLEGFLTEMLAGLTPAQRTLVAGIAG